MPYWSSNDLRTKSNTVEVIQTRIDSDHNMVMMKHDIKLKKLNRKERRKWNIKILTKNEEILENFKKRVEKENNMQASNNTDELWLNIKQGIKTGLNEMVEATAQPTRKPWITNEIIQLIEDRRK